MPLSSDAVLLMSAIFLFTLFFPGKTVSVSFPVKRRYLKVSALVALLGCAVAAHTQETETIHKTLDFAAAKALRIQGLSAHLNIETVSESGIRLILTGSKRQLESIVAEQTEDAVLLIKAPLQTSSSTIHINNGSNSTVIVNQSGAAQVTIDADGKSQVITTTAEPALRATVQLGATAPISIRGFSGSAVIAARQAPLDLELLSGEAEIAAVADAGLSITGSANIVVGRAIGKLSAAVRGSGNIVLNNARAEDLTVAIVGAGSVQVRGQVERADLTLSGVGDIYVEAVKQKPRRQLLGVGKIVVGNW